MIPKFKYYEARRCFLQPWKRPEAKMDKLLFQIPLFNKDGSRKTDHNNSPASEERWLTMDGFIDVLVHLQSIMPYRNVWQIHQMFFKNVCVRAFFDEFMNALAEAESTTAEYKGAVGDLSDDSVRESFLGFRIGYGDLLTAFAVIRASKNEFKRMELDEAEAKAGSGGGKKPLSRSAGRGGGAPQKVMGA